MTAISFTVLGPPVAKARARIVLNRGKVRAFTPAKTADYENRVRMAFTAKYPDFVPHEGPVSLWVRAIFQAKGSSKNFPTVHVIKRPDIDNCVKSIMDALNGLAWKDDAQVCVLDAEKNYGPKPCVNVYIECEDKP